MFYKNISFAWPPHLEQIMTCFPFDFIFQSLILYPDLYKPLFFLIEASIRSQLFYFLVYKNFYEKWRLAGRNKEDIQTLKDAWGLSKNPCFLPMLTWVLNIHWRIVKWSNGQAKKQRFHKVVDYIWDYYIWEWNQISCFCTSYSTCISYLII